MTWMVRGGSQVQSHGAGSGRQFDRAVGLKKIYLL
jgi:hypothetical protein